MQCDRKWIGKGGEIKNSPSQGFVRVVVVVGGEIRWKGGRGGGGGRGEGEKVNISWTSVISVRKKRRRRSELVLGKSLTTMEA